MHSFVGIDLGREPVPDETTICKFRHLVERRVRDDSAYAWQKQAFSWTGFDKEAVLPFRLFPEVCNATNSILG